MKKSTDLICFIFTPKIGEDSHFDEYFSNGLQPPTSTPLKINMEHNPAGLVQIIFLSKWVMAVGSMLIFQGVNYFLVIPFERFIWHHSCLGLAFQHFFGLVGAEQKAWIFDGENAHFFIRAMMIIAFPVNCDIIFSS